MGSHGVMNAGRRADGHHHQRQVYSRRTARRLSRKDEQRTSRRAARMSTTRQTVSAGKLNGAPATRLLHKSPIASRVPSARRRKQSATARPLIKKAESHIKVVGESAHRISE